MPGANLSLTPWTSSAMSARASLLTSVGRAWYSAWTRSGALCAFAAVMILVTRSSPDACFCTVTLMSGCLAFQRAATLSMPGAQAQ
ncbi:hypothetical protein SNARM312S_03941 [Streptomyces narbonensis]